jgi:hypothetical protein
MLWHSTLQSASLICAVLVLLRSADPNLAVCLGVGRPQLKHFRINPPTYGSRGSYEAKPCPRAASDLNARTYLENHARGRSGACVALDVAQTEDYAGSYLCRRLKYKAFGSTLS